MSPIITVENLSKAYRIGAKEEVPDTLVGAFKGILKSPFKNFRELRSLDTSKADSVSSDEILWALRDVSFEINEGDVVGIIGRNGAGKSTLLKVLSRITEPTGGRAVIRGRVSSLLEVGTGFHPELSGRENIYMNGTILGMTKKEIDRKFDEIVDFSGVEKFLDTPTKRYSSGMQVRLAFAVAAHLEPEILIVDEVLAVGDAEFQSRCLSKMEDVSSSGRTVLFVSHNMTAVSNLCKRGIVMRSGQVSFSGCVSEAVTHHLQVDDSSGQSLDLSTLPRNPSHSSVLKKLKLRNANDEISSEFACGSSLRVEIEYEQEEPIRSPRFGVIVEDDLGNRLFFVQTEVQYGKCPDLQGQGQISCLIESLPLAPGRYFLTLGCASRGQQLDYLERVGYFDVSEADFFGTGKLPPPTHGKILVKAEWQVDQSVLAQ